MEWSRETWPGDLALERGKGRTPDVRVNDMLPTDLDGRKDDLDHFQEVVDLVLGTSRVVWIIDWQVGRADQNTVLQGIDQRDSAITILEEKLVAVDRLQEFWMIEHQVRSLGSADKRSSLAHGMMELVDPGSCRIHDDFGVDRQRLSAELIIQHDPGSSTRIRTRLGPRCFAVVDGQSIVRRLQDRRAVPRSPAFPASASRRHSRLPDI